MSRSLDRAAKSSSYGSPVHAGNMCGELKKHKKYLEDSLETERKKLKDFIDLTSGVDMDYTTRQQVAGAFAIRIASIKEELTQHVKPKKKRKSKKSKK